MASIGQAVAVSNDNIFYVEEFVQTAYGRTPKGWRDLTNIRPSRNWAVDGRGDLRHTIKNHTGLIVYDGYTSEPKPASALADAIIVADFIKTDDESVSFGIAGRVQDRSNYYLARFRGGNRLELLIVKDGVESALDAVPMEDLKERRPTGRVTMQKYVSGNRWSMSLRLEGSRIEAMIFDGDGIAQARLSAVNDEFKKGNPGFCCTRFAATSSIQISALKPIESKADPARLAKRNAVISANEPDYPVLQAQWNAAEFDTPRDALVKDYDVIVAGAGTGGWAAAVQAARLGARVLLMEESDWIGGQMAAAGVTTMDEDSVWMKFPVRERGIYREFSESMVLHYLTMQKDPQVAYYGWPDQMEGGYEPKAARAVMYGFIKEVRDRGAVLDVSLRTSVSAVKKQGDTVTGATLTFANGVTQNIASKVLIDASEYGDVIPLTGARYRVGNVTSDKIDPTALVQDHTWTCIVREYPEGVPGHLIIKEPPPGYAKGSGKRYRKYTNDGPIIWGGAGKGYKGPRHWSSYFAWRGMADGDSPLIGEASWQRHTRCGFNGGNDYPVTVATIEDTAQRRLDEREGIYKTLGALYYFQHELGLNWSLAEDEGYATEANRAKMKSLDLRPDLEAIAAHLPQHPYVRECRRIIGVETLTAHDLGRFEQAKHVTTSVAMGDYFMDLDHGKTGHAIEAELDGGELPKPGGGPFQVPFGVFIPEKIDGFIPAEKNLSQSRLANGATRLQPITMLTGQAAGTIAALSAKQGVQPRALKTITVQQALLDSGCTLIQRWYADVPWGTELWRATQLLSLHQIMDRPGEIDRDSTVPLASKAKWGVEAELSAEERKQVLDRVAAHMGKSPELPAAALKAGEFAVRVARLLTQAGQP
ncbi:MAG: FAD-dependent oxidoreductase [Verrucomicrobiaceae bacterium]|nr:FAD-dependent oxidoreductase [Verrucomicrobiaceae bacterium]